MHLYRWHLFNPAVHVRCIQAGDRSRVPPHRATWGLLPEAVRTGQGQGLCLQPLWSLGTLSYRQQVEVGCLLPVLTQHHPGAWLWHLAVEREPCCGLLGLASWPEQLCLIDGCQIPLLTQGATKGVVGPGSPWGFGTCAAVFGAGAGCLCKAHPDTHLIHISCKCQALPWAFYAKRQLKLNRECIYRGSHNRDAEQTNGASVHGAVSCCMEIRKSGESKDQARAKSWSLTAPRSTALPSASGWGAGMWVTA